MKLIIALILLSFDTYASSLVKGCESGKASHCFEYAYQQSLAGDQLAPLTYFEKGCQLQDGKSCYALDKVYKKLNQKINNPELLVKACDYSFGVSCAELGEYYFKNQNYLLSIESYNKGCQLGHTDSCTKKFKYDTYFSKVIRSKLDDLNERDRGVQTKYLSLLAERMKVNEKECTEKNYNSCTELSEDYLFLANIESAKKWATIACDNKVPLGCLALGEVEQKEGKNNLAAFEKACGLNLGIACLRYAQSIESKNLARAMSYYRRSCQSEDEPNASSCMKYSLYHKANPKLAAKFKKIACKLDKSICKN